MAKTSKAVSEASATVLNKIGDALVDQVKSADINNLTGGAAKTSGFRRLEELSAEYDQVNVSIWKYDNANEKQYFTELKGRLVKDLLAIRPEAIVKEEGGGGVYHMEYTTLDGAHTVTFAKIKVAGPSMPTARSEGGWFPGVAGALPTTDGGASKPREDIAGVIRALNESNRSALQQQSGGNDKLWQMMMAMMLERSQGGGSAAAPPAPAASPELLELRNMITGLNAKLEATQAAAREQAHKQEIDSLRKDLERMGMDMVKAAATPDKRDPIVDLLAAQVAASKGDRAASDALWLQLIPMLTNKGGGHAEIMKMVTESTLGSLNMITQLAASGLTGGGAPSASDVIMKVLDTAERAAAAYLSSMAEDDEPEVPEVPERQATVEVEHPEVKQIAGVAPEAAQEVAPEPEITAEQKNAEILRLLETMSVDTIPAKALVSEDEMVRVKTSDAWRPALNALRSGELGYKETTARVFALANGTDKLARKFMTYPVYVIWQILTPMGLADQIAPLTIDVVEFWDFVTHEGNPNEWCDKYKPIKRRQGPPAPPAPAAQVEVDAPEVEE